MRRIATAAAACALMTAFGGAAAAHAVTEPTGRALVTLAPPGGERPAGSAASARAFTARTGARPAGPFVPQIGLVTVDIPDGADWPAFARALAADPAVEHVQLDRRMSWRLIPNDPALTVPESAPGTPPDVPVQWTAARQALFGAWDISIGATALVGVIDSGIDADHPEFAGRIAATFDRDLTTSHGPPTVDENGHGTHVSSLACAAANNALALAGAGFGCQLIFVKTDLTFSSIAQSIVDATDAGAHAINMSFGDDGSNPPSAALQDAIAYAHERGVVLVAAAADEPVEEQGQPANLLQPAGTAANPDLGMGLVVTAAEFDDTRADFAGRGPQISLAAYGAFGDSGGPPGLFGAFPGNTTEIETGSLVPPVPPCRCRTTFGGDDRYAYLQGTSMAAPQVAAVGALARELNPDITITELLRLLKLTARRPAGSEWGPELGWGIVDGGSALEVARTLDRRPPVSRAFALRFTRLRAFIVRWAAIDPALPPLVPAGVSHFEVWASKGEGPRLIRRTRQPGMIVRGLRGSVYGFFTLAVDRQGNREPFPERYDAITRVSNVAR